MSAPNPQALEYTLRVLRDWMNGRTACLPPPDLSPDSFAALAAANRTAPLLHLALGPVLAAPAWRETASILADAYHQALSLGLAQLAEGAELSAALERGGVPALAFRGPFAACELYGDPGVRPAHDIDLLVPAGARDRALEIARQAGYELCDALTPLWFTRRHHFQWTLRHRGHGTLCDIHWAVHQPYKPIRVDYDGIFARAEPAEGHGRTWRRPAPGDALILACIHTVKEYSAAPLRALSAAPPADVLGRRVAMPWLDAARIVAVHSRKLDWPAILDRAGSWRASPDLASVLAGAAGWFDAPVPGRVTESLRPVLVEHAAYLRAMGHDTLYAESPDGHPGEYRSMFARFGMPHVAPPRSYFGGAHGPRLLGLRAGHAASAVVRLGAGFLEGLLRDAAVAFRRARSRGESPGHPPGPALNSAPPSDMMCIPRKTEPNEENPMLDEESQFTQTTDVVRRRVADETILVPVRKTAEALDSIYSINPVAARIWDLLDGKKTLGEIRDALLQEYDVPAEELDRDIADFVEQLKSERLIQET